MALRNLVKNRFSFLVVFISLIVGFTVTLFAGIYLYNEINYDKFHTKENICRVGFRAGFAEKKTDYAFSWAPLGPKMKEFFPEVIDFVRLYHLPSASVVKYGEKKYLSEKLFYADQDFFDFFSFKLIRGNPRTVLEEPNSAVLTERIASQYFGTQNPIGKILKINNKEYVVTGISKSPPVNSHIKFNILLSMSSMIHDKIGSENALESWKRVNYYTYLQFLNKKSVEKVIAGRKSFIDKELFMFKRDLNVDIDLIIQPIENIHLHSHLDRELEPNNSTSNLWIVFLIALFVLVISCVNFILITTNINITRFKEVYIKKVAGQSKYLMLSTYLLEILVICFISFLFALLLFYQLLPQYNLIIHSGFSWNYLINWKIITGIIALLLIVSIVPGYISGKILFSFTPNSTRYTPASYRVYNNSVILIIQFCIAFALIICTLIFTGQLNYIQNYKLGYDKSDILLIHINENYEKNAARSICENFMKLSDVRSVSISSNHLAKEPLTFAVSLSRQKGNNEIQTNYNNVDYNFKKTYGLKIEEGRFFSMDFPTDSSGIVVNQTFCKEFGLTDPINKNVYYLGMEFKIIGVVKDFYFNSFRERIEPYLMFFKGNNRRNNYISVKLNHKINRQIIKKLDGIWSEAFPDDVLDYSSYEDKLQTRYENDMMLVKLMKYLSLVVVIIALSGLLGQNFLILRLRKKEIAIRKVLGADFSNLLVVLTKKYFILMLIAWAGASVISYFLTGEWLNNFIFRIENRFLYYIFPVIFSMLISILFIGFRTAKTLKMNPAETLKEE